MPENLTAAHGGENLVLLTPAGWRISMGDLATNQDGSGTVWTHNGSGPSPTRRDGRAVLAYGSAIRVGSTVCRSEATGVTCSNGVASFTLNSHGVTGTGATAPSN